VDESGDKRKASSEEVIRISKELSRFVRREKIKGLSQRVIPYFVGLIIISLATVFALNCFEILPVLIAVDLFLTLSFSTFLRGLIN